MDRKLATILVGDFVGSSAAMEADEERMLARVMQALDAVTPRQRRRIARATDWLLAERPALAKDKAAAQVAGDAGAGRGGSVDRIIGRGHTRP